MSAVLSLAKPHRIKASHRRRWKGTTGHRLYIMNNPLSGTDPTGYTPECVDAGCPEPAPAQPETKPEDKNQGSKGSQRESASQKRFNMHSNGQGDPARISVALVSNGAKANGADVQKSTQTPNVSSNQKLDIVNGFNGEQGGGGEKNDDYISSTRSISFGRSKFQYTTEGPKGFAEQIHSMLSDIVNTKAGAALLTEITKNNGTVQIVYLRGSGAMAHGSIFNKHTIISIDPDLGQKIQTDRGPLVEKGRFILAHELHHAWKNSLSCWLGCDRPLIPPGVIPARLPPSEVHAVRYTNIIQSQSGAGYQRTDYAGIAIP